MLKTQFDEEIRVTSDLEQTFTEHNNTVKGLHDVIIEREDLSPRLSILSKGKAESLTELAELHVRHLTLAKPASAAPEHPAIPRPRKAKTPIR